MIILHIRVVVITWIGDKSIFHDDAPIIPNFFFIKDLLIGIVTESILLNIKLTVNDLVIVTVTNGLLVSIIKHIGMNIPAGWLGRPWIHHYRLPCTT